MLNTEQQPLSEIETGSAEETGVTAADAGQEEQGPGPQDKAARMSWQEIMADPEYKRLYDAQVQSIIQKRLRSRGAAEERLQRLEPVLAALGQRFGTDGETDAERLVSAILAGEDGGQRQNRARLAEEHLAELMRQEAALRSSFPDFELLSAMEDPAFVRLTAPHTGLTLEDAYYALHHREIGEATAKRSLEAAASAVRSGSARPKELSGRQAASTGANDPRAMSKEQREALKKRIYEAKAQGKRLPFGA